LCNRHRIFAFFQLLEEPKAHYHVYLYDNRAIVELRSITITVHARPLGHTSYFVVRPAGRPVTTGDGLKFRVVHSPGRRNPGRSKTGKCERGLSLYRGTGLFVANLNRPRSRHLSDGNDCPEKCSATHRQIQHVAVSVPSDVEGRGFSSCKPLPFHFLLHCKR
jgi:hypothetical protein